MYLSSRRLPGNSANDSPTSSVISPGPGMMSITIPIIIIIKPTRLRTLVSNMCTMLRFLG